MAGLGPVMAGPVPAIPGAFYRTQERSCPGLRLAEAGFGRAGGTSPGM